MKAELLPKEVDYRFRASARAAGIQERNRLYTRIGRPDYVLNCRLLEKM